MDMAQFTIEGVNPDVVKVEILDTVQGLKRISSKRIVFKDFVKILNNSIVQEKMLRIGKIPTGFYDGCLDANGYGFECLVVIPEGIKPIEYYESNYNIPFPKQVFYFKVMNERVVAASTYALKDEKVTDNTMLYHYPFGNVYDNGRICFGQNSITGIKDLRSVEKAVSMFFGSSTNNDLWDNKRINIPSDDPRMLQRGLIESLVGKKKFPKTILVPTKQRVGDILKSKN